MKWEKTGSIAQFAYCHRKIQYR